MCDAGSDIGLQHQPRLLGLLREFSQLHRDSGRVQVACADAVISPQAEQHRIELWRVAKLPREFARTPVGLRDQRIGIAPVGHERWTQRELQL